MTRMAITCLCFGGIAQQLPMPQVDIADPSGDCTESNAETHVKRGSGAFSTNGAWRDEAIGLRVLSFRVQALHGTRV